MEMAWRLGALLLAVHVTAAPMSLTVCEILCATRASAHTSGDAGAQEHSCHDTQPAGSSGAMRGHGHVCGHADELPVSSSVTVDHPVLYPAVVAVALAPIFSVHIVPVAQPTGTSPPAPPVFRVPLRI